MKKTIGILGGMGPLATCDLFSKCLALTEAACDQEHLHILVDSNTDIPDRTAAILHGGQDPIPQMARSAIRLQAMGAELLLLPCNTAHYFYDRLAAFVDIPMLHMLDITAQAVKARGMDTVALLATDGTIQTGIYDRIMASHGIKTVKPAAASQRFIMDLIYKGVKAGNFDLDVSPMQALHQEVQAAGAQTLILGCTELPVAFSMFHLPYSHIDPTLELARQAVLLAGGNLKQDKNSKPTEEFSYAH